jgi:Calcium binding
MAFSDRMEDMTQKQRKPVVAVHKDVRRLKPKPETSLPSVSKARLEKLVAEAVVDAYTEEEQAVGLLTMIQDHLAVPFSVKILGVEAVVEKVDMTRDGRIVAVCRRENIRQRIGILDLALPTPPPAGAEWIAAYHHWRRGF